MGKVKFNKPKIKDFTVKVEFSSNKPNRIVYDSRDDDPDDINYELLSDCCGSSCPIPELGICPECLEHCEFINEEE